MEVRRKGVTAAVLAAACLALAIGASIVGDAPGLALRFRCWLGPPLTVCRNLARERENRALEAVEKELRDLSRFPSPVCFDPGSQSTIPCPSR